MRNMRLEQRRSGTASSESVPRPLRNVEYRLQGPVFSLQLATVTGVAWLTSMPDPLYVQGHLLDPEQFIEGHFGVLNCPTHQGLTTMATHMCTITLFSADADKPDFIGFLHLSKDVSGRRFKLKGQHHTVYAIFIPYEMKPVKPSM